MGDLASNIRKPALYAYNLSISWKKEPIKGSATNCFTLPYLYVLDERRDEIFGVLISRALITCILSQQFRVTLMR